MSKKEVRRVQRETAEAIRDQFKPTNEKGEENMNKQEMTAEEMEQVKEILTEAIEKNDEVSQAVKEMMLKEINQEFSEKENGFKNFVKKVFTKKNVVRVIGATAVVAVIGGVIYMIKNGTLDDESVSIDATDDMVTITEL